MCKRSDDRKGFGAKTVDNWWAPFTSVHTTNSICFKSIYRIDAILQFELGRRGMVSKKIVILMTTVRTRLWWEGFYFILPSQ